MKTFFAIFAAIFLAWLAYYGLTASVARTPGAAKLMLCVARSRFSLRG
jgi:hypothetical protein